MNSLQAEIQPQPKQARNVFDHGPVQFITTVENKGDLIPLRTIPRLTKNYNQSKELVIICSLGIIGRGKSTWANILNWRLLGHSNFTPFQVRALTSTTKGLWMFSNPLQLRDNPNVQVINMDMEGAYGLPNKPSDTTFTGLMRLYTLGMILSSVVLIHLSRKPGQDEIDLITKSTEMIVMIKEKLYLDLPQIYLLIQDAEESQEFQLDIQNIRDILKERLQAEVFDKIQILARGELSDQFLKSDPFDYSKVDPGYVAQIDKIISNLHNNIKINPINRTQNLKISDFPELIQGIGVGILNNSEYKPYLERAVDQLRMTSLNKIYRIHVDNYTEECKRTAEDPNILALTIEQYRQNAEAIKAKHKAAFIQETEAATGRKADEFTILNNLNSQFDILMNGASSEQIFIDKKAAQEQQEAERMRYDQLRQQSIQQNEALQQQIAIMEQQRQAQMQQFQQERDRANAEHQQRIEEAKQRAEEQKAQNVANAQRMQEEMNRAQEESQRQAEEIKMRTDLQNQQLYDTEQAEQDRRQKFQEEINDSNKANEELQRQVEEQRKQFEEEEVERQKQLNEAISESNDDDDGDGSSGDCCNIF